MTRRILLACGIAAPVLYALADAVAGMRWAGYSFRDQTISELAAIGAPSRPLFAGLLVGVYALLTLFGIGVWKEAGRDGALRVTGGLLIGLGVVALTLGQFASMRLRGTEQGLAGALHLVEGLAAMLMTFTGMGFAAVALGRRFRAYTILTLVMSIVLGVWSSMEISAVGEGLATPWLGVKERLFWYGYQAWFLVLAIALIRRSLLGRSDGGQTGGGVAVTT